MLNLDLTGKRALVTGANSGLGEATAKMLAAAGADVAINYVVHPDAAEEVAEAVRKTGSKSMTIKADISDEGEVDAMFDRIDAEWDGLDILVNNAGIDGKRQLSWESDTDEWRKVMEINLFGTFYCCRQALKRMVPAAQGVICNMSSVHETIAWGGYSAYASSKAGISMLTKTLAQEVAQHGIRVFAVAPGAIRTPINRSVWGDKESYADLMKKIPLGRMGTPDEIAKVITALVSDYGSYLTASTVFVDGGMTDFADFAHGG